MKLLGLILGLCLITGLAFADATAEILKTDLDNHGNIRVYINYKIDGVEVPSNYPKLNGKYYWITRYSAHNFYGLNDAEKQARIDKDIKSFGENLIKKNFILEARQLTVDANDNIVKSDFANNIIGHKVIIKDAEMLIDTDFDAKPDKKWTVKSDGTKTITDYTPAVTP